MVSDKGTPKYCDLIVIYADPMFGASMEGSGAKKAARPLCALLILGQLGPA